MLQLELAMGGMAAVLILVDMRCRGAALVLDDDRILVLILALVGRGKLAAGG